MPFGLKLCTASELLLAACYGAALGHPSSFWTEALYSINESYVYNQDIVQFFTSQHNMGWRRLFNGYLAQ
eukprot:14560764-Ditylum_brightwellii.AAC.1